MRDLGQQPTTWMGTGCCATDANQQRSQHSARLGLQPGKKTARCQVGSTVKIGARTRRSAVAAAGHFQLLGVGGEPITGGNREGAALRSAELPRVHRSRCRQTLFNGSLDPGACVCVWPFRGVCVFLSFCESCFWRGGESLWVAKLGSFGWRWRGGGKCSVSVLFRRFLAIPSCVAVCLFVARICLDK